MFPGCDPRMKGQETNRRPDSVVPSSRRKTASWRRHLQRCDRAKRRSGALAVDVSPLTGQERRSPVRAGDPSSLATTLARVQVIEGSLAVARSGGGRSEVPIAELVGSLSVEQLREVVSSAADRHEDVARAVRLLVGRADGDLAAQRARSIALFAPGGSSPTGRPASGAHSARPVVEELRRHASSSPSGS